MPTPQQYLGAPSYATTPGRPTITGRLLQDPEIQNLYGPMIRDLRARGMPTAEIELQIRNQEKARQDRTGAKVTAPPSALRETEPWLPKAFEQLKTAPGTALREGAAGAQAGAQEWLQRLFGTAIPGAAAGMTPRGMGPVPPPFPDDMGAPLPPMAGPPAGPPLPPMAGPPAGPPLPPMAGPPTRLPGTQSVTMPLPPETPATGGLPDYMAAPMLPTTPAPSSRGAYAPGPGIDNAIARLMGAPEAGVAGPETTMPVSDQAALLSASAGPPPKPGFWQDPEASRNLMEFGLRLMAASDPRPGAIRGPSAFGAIGQAGAPFMEDLRKRRLAKTTAETEERRFQTKTSLEREKIEATRDLKKETLRLRAEQDQIANELRRQGNKIDAMRARDDALNKLRQYSAPYQILAAEALGDDEKAAAARREIEEAERKVTEPYDAILGGPSRTAPRPGASREGGAEQTKTIRGKTYVKIGGQWYEQ